MSGTATMAWLPRDAIVAAADRLPVRAAVADWAARWFARGGASVAGHAAIDGDATVTGAVVALDDGLVLAVPDETIAAVGVLMFGEPEGEPTTADRAAIDAAAEQALADLRSRAAHLAGLPRDAAWRPRDGTPAEAGYCFRIRVGHVVVTLSVADRLLVANVRARLRPDAVRPLGTIAAGIADHGIAVSARVGACRLTIAELTGLTTGDVVVLDRPLDAAADLVVDRRPQAARCTIAAGTAHLDLILA